jgi:hypothetical protein
MRYCSNHFLLALGAALLVSVFGCSGQMVVHEPGETTVDRTSGRKPSWVIRSPREDRKNVVMLGVGSDATLERATRMARLQALDMTLEQACSGYKTLYHQAVEGLIPSSEEGTDLEWVLSEGERLLRSMLPAGVKEEDQYWERHRYYGAYGNVQYTFKVWELVSLSGSDFTEATRAALFRLEEEARNRADTKAMELLARMNADLEETNFLTLANE